MLRVRRLPKRSLSWLLLTAGTLFLLAALSLFSLVAAGLVGSSAGSSGPETVTGFGSVLSARTPATPPTSATALTTAPLARVVIPAAKVDAPIVTKGVDSQSVMQAPDNATDVVWYDFSSRPGGGSNAVFSGHVDYVKVGPAVFWNMRDLQPGDNVEIRYADGTSIAYAVSAVNTFDAATAPIDQIVGSTPNDVLTFITCAGTFNPVTHQYDKRLVVRARKV